MAKDAAAPKNSDLIYTQPNSDILFTEEVAALVRKTPASIRWMKHVGTGPKWGKLGKRVIYRRVDVEAWIAAAFEGGAASTSAAGLEITAHHEAGHAVAVLLRGGGQLHSIDINETAAHRGYTHFSAKVFDVPFITYAGPWAEARSQWPMDDLDGEDEYGHTFDDYVAAAFLANIDGDAEAYTEALSADPTTFAIFQHRREQVWNKELEREWHTIQLVARRLLTIGADMHYSPDHRAWHDVIEDLLGLRV